MTEEEWLACEDPERMFQQILMSASTRRQRLFCIACCHRVWHLIPSECAHWGGNSDVYAKALEITERYVEGKASLDEVRSHSVGTGGYRACDVVAVTNGLHDWVDGLSTVSVWASAAMAGSETYLIPWDDDTGPAGSKQLAELAVHCSLLRDIFGNPFRPITFPPSWRTDTAIALAQQMYDSRDFGAMPILADAL